MWECGVGSVAHDKLYPNILVNFDKRFLTLSPRHFPIDRFWYYLIIQRLCWFLGSNYFSKVWPNHQNLQEKKGPSSPRALFCLRLYNYNCKLIADIIWNFVTKKLWMQCLNTLNNRSNKPQILCVNKFTLDNL